MGFCGFLSRDMCKIYTCVIHMCKNYTHHRETRHYILYISIRYIQYVVWHGVCKDS